MTNATTETTTERNDLPTEFKPAESYNGNFALLCGAGSKKHIVDTTTFNNKGGVRNKDGSSYDGYTPNIGHAETLCGRRLVGRMIPLDPDSRVIESRICGTCLRALEAKEETEE